jgi:ADP-heptose:LPS heptosyltransferase
MVRFGKTIGFVAGGIGDQMYHFTQLRALAEVSASGTIDIACLTPAPIADLLNLSPWAGKIIDARPFRRYLPGIRGEKTVGMLKDHYDTAFVLHRSTSFKLVALRAGIPKRIGFEGNYFDRFLLSDTLRAEAGGNFRNRWGHRRYIGAIEEWMFEQGLELDDINPTVIADKERVSKLSASLDEFPRPFIIANGFVQNPIRRWPVEHFASCLISTATATGGSIILNAGPDAKEYFDEVMGILARIDIPVKNSLGLTQSIHDSVALYHLADIYVGVDSFTANLAYNCNLPAVSIFPKPSDALSYKPGIVPIFPKEEGKIDTINPALIIEASATLLKA